MFLLFAFTTKLFVNDITTVGETGMTIQMIVLEKSEEVFEKSLASQQETVESDDAEKDQQVLMDNRKAGDESNFTPRYIEIDILVPGKAAVAYYYLVGSFTMSGVTKNDYRTRVSQVFVTENKEWKIKGGHFSPLHGGSGIID